MLGIGGDDGAAKAAKIAKQTQQLASEAQARAQASADAAATATKNMQANFATDLRQENVGTVVAGGTADASAAATDLKKKKLGSGSLSSQLGINV